MFIELFKPQVIDLTATRDRVKVIVGEPSSTGRFWINLTFENRDQLREMISGLTSVLNRETDEYHKS